MELDISPVRVDITVRCNRAGLAGYYRSRGEKEAAAGRPNNARMYVEAAKHHEAKLKRENRNRAIGRHTLLPDECDCSYECEML